MNKLCYSILTSTSAIAPERTKKPSIVLPTSREPLTRFLLYLIGTLLRVTELANQLLEWISTPFRITTKFLSLRLDNITENLDAESRFEEGSRAEAARQTKVPQFYAYLVNDDEDGVVSIIAAVTGIVFGAIHCAAWSFEFMSTTDLLIWRISSLVITGIPMMFLVLIFAVDGVLKPLSIHRPGVRTFIRAHVSPIFFKTLFPPYAIARIALLVEVLMGLKRLSKSTQEVINWNEVMPHI